jgi:tripartite-type tricarboxylate transporter receptor subunit TctC
VRILIPFAPGGTSDMLGRLVAPKLGEALGHHVFVDHRAGANTVNASLELLKSPPDATTLLLAGSSHVLLPFLTSEPLRFDPTADFAPVASIARTGLILVVHEEMPAKSLAQLVALAKSSSQPLACASAGGSVNHLAMEVFNKLAGVKLQHIDFRGSAPAVSDLAAAQADCAFQTPAAVLAHLRTGKLRGLAISGGKPFNDPEIPTFAQAGLPGFDVGLSYGLLAHARTPADVIERISEAMKRVVTTPDFSGKAAAQGLEALASSPAQFGALLKSESERLGGFLRK